MRTPTPWLGACSTSGMAPVDASRLFATFYAGNPVFGQQSRALSGATETVTSEESAEGR